MMNKNSENSAEEMDAFDLLTADHHEVEKLFKQYKKLTHQDDNPGPRQELVGKICQALSVHAQIEEEIFYPALREAATDSDLLDEAEVEHASVKSLIKQIKSAKPDDALYDAKVIVLAEYVEHHVKEEEGEIFKRARKAKINVDDLGMKLAARKAELMKTEAGSKTTGAERPSAGASRAKKTAEQL